MKLELIGHSDRYAVEQLQMSLFGTQAEGEAVSRLCRGNKFLTAVTTITLNGNTSRVQRRLQVCRETVRLRRQLLQQCYYKAALPHLPQVPAWGALAGVRPTKLSTRHLLEGGTAATARKLLEKDYYVTPQRSRLAADCSVATVRAAGLLRDKDISLYVGIPFCPTRCSYCSFVSRSVGKATAKLEPYLEALEQELALVAEALKRTGYRVRSLYMGGGTPTTLSASQLDRLLTNLERSLDLTDCLEFTVECGRPDTITEEKLAVIRSHGVERISINPQTMEDPVLRACGRPHTAEDVLRSYRQAEALGFIAVNMDLIAGLPEDSYEGFCRSLETVAGLNPANITVHTLALKKGADLFEKQVSLPDGQTVANMVEYANRRLSALGYKPYYLYRQKYMSGSFENVGWSKNGLDCLYNIYMMEELHTILSIGGGGMNKVNLPDGTLQRFHNPKFPEQYLEQLPDVLRQKREIFSLLQP